MTTTLTCIDHTLALWEGPAMDFLKTDSGTLESVLQDRLALGTVVVIDLDGSVTDYYNRNPSLTPDGWADTHVYAWSPLEAVLNNPMAEVIAHALIAGTNNPTDDFDTTRCVAAILQIAAATDTSLAQLAEWAKPLDPEHFNENVYPLLRQLVDAPDEPSIKQNNLLWLSRNIDTPEGITGLRLAVIYTALSTFAGTYDEADNALGYISEPG